MGVGFGITPTLSKAANHAAKKLEGFNGVAVITCNQEAKDILSRMKVTDVWGVGSRLGRRLNMMRIYTAYDLAKQSPKNMRSQFSVVLERTIEELNGNVCLSWDEVKQDKQEIFSTRSFGERVTNIRDLNAALITHSSIVGKKLREQASLTNSLLIFAHSSQHEGNFYKRSFLYDFATPTNDSRVLASAVSEVLPQIYSDDVRFYKAGVGAIDLTSEYFFQSDLFTPNIDNQKLMSSMDNINKIFGKGTIRLASEQQNTRWSMKRNFLSPRYTSRWRDIPIIKC